MQEGPRPGDDLPPGDDAHDAGLVRITALALVAGAIAGLVCGLFRAALAAAESWRTTLLDWTREAPALRWLIPVALAALAVAVARLIVRWVPEASGSGVQRVEAAVRDEIPLASRLRIVPAKLVGGVLAIGGGLALGREGPSVHMGAVIGERIGTVARMSAHDARTMTSALGGAGLAVAFSATLGGAVFVFEELTRAFRTRLVLATLACVVAAMAVARLIVGSEPVFAIPPVRPEAMWTLPLFGLLGLLLGAAGVAYNRAIILMIDAFAAVRSLAPEVKAGAVGALVGVLGIIAPDAVGSGDALNEEVLLGGVSILALVLILIVRGLLGPLSYSLGTPGGLFAPLLFVGAAAGALLASLANAVAPAAHVSPTAFAVVGMSTRDIARLPCRACASRTSCRTTQRPCRPRASSSRAGVVRLASTTRRS